METANDRMRPALEVAAENAGAWLHQFVETIEVSEAVQMLELQLSEDRTDILSLRDEGLLSLYESEEQLAILIEHEDYRLLRFVRIAGGISLAVGDASVVYVDETEHSETAKTDTPASDIKNGLVDVISFQTEALIEKQPAELTIINFEDGSKHLKVGRSRGKKISFSGKQNSKSNKNYTNERAVFLEAIAEANGEEISIGELRKKLDAAGLDSSKETTLQVKVWLDSIKFYGKSIFIHNGKRGKGSSYHTNEEFDVSVSHKDAKISKGTTTRSHETKASQEITLATSINKGLLPLRETTVFASILHGNRELLDALDIPCPGKNIVKHIDDASGEEDRLKGVQRTNTDIEKLKEERKRVALQFKAVMTDTDLFDTFADSLTEDDAIYPFIEYLLDLDQEQWDIVINQVLESRIVATTISDSSGCITGTYDAISLPNGRIFEHKMMDDGTKSFKEIVVKLRNTDTEESTLQIIPSPRTSNQEQVREVFKESPEHISIIRNDAPSTVEEEVVASDTKNSTVYIDTKTTPEVKWQTDLKKLVGDTLAHFDEIGLVFEGAMDAKRIGLISDSNKMATNEAIERLESNGKKAISKSGSNPHDWEFDMSAVVTMQIQNEIRNIFDSRQKSRQAHRIIEECTAKFLQEWRSRTN